MEELKGLPEGAGAAAATWQERADRWTSADATIKRLSGLSVGQLAEDAIEVFVESNCVVTMQDFANIAAAWQAEADPPADLDGSGRIDLAELQALGEAWLLPCPPAWPFRR